MLSRSLSKKVGIPRLNRTLHLTLERKMGYFDEVCDEVAGLLSTRDRDWPGVGWVSVQRSGESVGRSDFGH